MKAHLHRAPCGPRFGQALLLIPLVLFPGCQTVTELVSPPAKTVCKRTASLCGMPDEKVASCEAEIKKTQLEPQRLREMAACVDKAANCAEAAGCAAGVGLGAAMDSAKDFLKGMQRALDKK